MKVVFENKEQDVLVKRIKGFQGFLPAFHDHIELVLVTDGALRVSISGKERILQAGDMGVCFPYQIHSYEQSENAEVLLVLFPSKAADVYADTLLKVRPQVPFLRPAPHMITLMERLKDCVYEQDARALAAVYLNAIAGELLIQMPTEPIEKKDTNAIQKLFLYCQEHYKENITVRSVSRAVNISQSYITKIFSAQYGCAFRTYINRLRMMDVKKLLLDTDRTATDIMLSCGFNNQSTFNRVFFEETAMTPRAYRKAGKTRR